MATEKTDQAKPDFCKSIAERAESLGISPITLRRTIDRGEGPTVTQLSRHRIGIRESHWAAWLDSRDRKPEQVAA